MLRQILIILVDERQLFGSRPLLLGGKASYSFSTPEVVGIREPSNSKNLYRDSVRSELRTR